MIIVSYKSCDGYRVSRKYKTLAGARAFAVKYVGERPDIGSSYAVSPDGLGVVRVIGASLADLFAIAD